jgi:hypothetical protein
LVHILDHFQAVSLNMSHVTELSQYGSILVLIIIIIILHVIITKIIKNIFKFLKILSLKCKILCYLSRVVGDVYLPRSALMFLYVFEVFYIIFFLPS